MVDEVVLPVVRFDVANDRVSSVCVAPVDDVEIVATLVIAVADAYGIPGCPRLQEQS